MKQFTLRFSLAVLASAFLFLPRGAWADTASPREMKLLNGPDWQFVGAGPTDTLPEVDSDGFKSAAWAPVSVPHVFQTRAAYDTLAKGWYKRQITLDPAAQGKELYLVFEGAASIADVYVNGQHLGQHRGAYTRFIFDATAALHPGANELAVLVNDTPADISDCLPNVTAGLYKVWGGLYRNVWLLQTSPVHIDPTDYAAPGVYLTPTKVSADSADLDVRTLLRNASATDAQAQVKARIVDPDGKEVTTLTGTTPIPAHGTATSELTTTIKQPQLWSAHQGKLYHVETTILVNGQPVDELTQATGFRWLNWDWTGGTVTLNGKRIILYGADLHQETEERASAVLPEDLKANFDAIQDLGLNFMRFPHYPHAALEYELCDQDGILAWAEDGHSAGKDIVSPTAAQIVTEMVKQNYNHPSIVVWSMGNESNSEVADECVPITKALDPTRPVVVANQKSTLADFRTKHLYAGWYHADMDKFIPDGFISEIGVGGVVTTHCDYNNVDWKVGSYEPEEWQQLVSENNFQRAFHGDDSKLGLFCVWCLREFSDSKYKAPVGINSKGLETYAASKKDAYYIYRTFLRPDVSTVWITSKRYFLRRGAVDNGIKVYSNAPKVTLTLNGKTVSTLANGQYVIPSGPYLAHAEKQKVVKGEPPPPPPPPRPYVPEKIDNVFYWPVPLNPGKNTVTATDDKGNSDSATIYYYGADSTAPVPADPTLPIANLTSSNAANPAYFMDMPVQAQWPIYYDLDGSADNSWNEIPPEVEGASWIALLRVTKPDPIDTSKRAKPTAPEPNNATDISFTATRAEKVFIMATKQDPAPAFAAAGFKEVATTTPLDWRNNALLLVPAQLYEHDAAAGEKIQLSLGDRDAVVLIK